MRLSIEREGSARHLSDSVAGKAKIILCAPDAGLAAKMPALQWAVAHQIKGFNIIVQYIVHPQNMARELCNTVPTVEQLLRLMDIQKIYERKRANQARAGMKWYHKNRESLLPKGREYMRRRRAEIRAKKDCPDDGAIV